MADASRDDLDQQAYATIRQVAFGHLKMWFEGVAFEPLFGRHHDVVSVTAFPYVGRAGGDPLWLTVWQGYRDGTGEDGGEEDFWLLIEKSEHLQLANPTWRRNARPVFLPITPDAPGLGLTLPDLQLDTEQLLKLISNMVKLLVAGIPVHRRRARRDEAFDALNAALQGEFPELDVEDDGGVADLEQLCADSDLESVEFGPYGAPGVKPFAASTFVDAGDQVQLTVWSDDDGVRWVDVSGEVQRMDGPELTVPARDRQEAELVEELVGQLGEIHDVARSIFHELDPGQPETAFDLLNAVAYLAMNGGMGSDNLDGRSWHLWADQFGSHCKLGFLAGVMLEESPFGNLNIRATTLDPISRTSTDLQVYWKQDDEGQIPEHWLSVGTATAPAHDVDPEYPELLAGTPLEVRDYIRHAIGHLHEMVHLAGSVLEARTEEVIQFVEAKRTAEAVPTSVEHEMLRTPIDDAIAGLNGMARLYTGAMPGEVR
ncbi:hypothetical protein [Paenarthrobacter sp. C1]|uniref:hypothetical protein n=1 Tax=Paenarthrobacter sp. C1 TaxID=3400220 RepID=UPI003BF5D464